MNRFPFRLDLVLIFVLHILDNMASDIANLGDYGLPNIRPSLHWDMLLNETDDIGIGGEFDSAVQHFKTVTSRKMRLVLRALKAADRRVLRCVFEKWFICKPLSLSSIPAGSCVLGIIQRRWAIRRM